MLLTTAQLDEFKAEGRFRFPDWCLLRCWPGGRGREFYHGVKRVMVYRESGEMASR